MTPLVAEDTTNQARSREPEFLTVEEIAEQLRVGRWTVYRMMEDGALPAVWPGRKLCRVPREGFEQWKKRQLGR